MRHLVSAILDPLKDNKIEKIHAGPADALKLHPRNNFCIFNPMELKLCNITDIAIPNKSMFFCFSILTVFGGKMTSTKLVHLILKEYV